MAKIEAGCKLADFSFNTPFESDVKLSEKAKGAKKTVLLFLRYYGCTLCQLDIREYANAYDRFKEKDAQLLVVLQSPASTINAQLTKEVCRSISSAIPIWVSTRSLNWALPLPRKL